jgi:hypothetical protein
MSLRRLALALPVVLLLAACGDDDCTGPSCPGTPPLGGRLYVVNAAPELGDLQLLVDGGVERPRIAPGTSSGAVFTEPGEHGITLFRLGQASNRAEFGVRLNDGQPRLVVARSVNGTVTPTVLSDTGSIVPAGATKLRVVHMAAGAPAVDVWRTQPDFPTNVRVMTPFAFQGVSPYLQSTPGTWTVTVTPRNEAATAPANALATITVALLEGESASIVLVPGATAGSVSLVRVKEF